MYCISALNISAWPWIIRFSMIPHNTLRLISPIEFSPSLFNTSSTVSTIFPRSSSYALQKNRKWSGSSSTKHTVHISETLSSILALCWFSKVCPDSNWFNIEKLCRSSSPQQFLFPTSVNTSWTRPALSDKSNFLFHLSLRILLISATASFLSIIFGNSSISAPTISLAASLAWLSASSFPSMSLCPGTQCTLISFPLSDKQFTHSLICKMISTFPDGMPPLNAALIAGWRSVKTWILVSFSCSSKPIMKSRAICIPTSSPV